MNNNTGFLLLLAVLTGSVFTQADASQHHKCKINIGSVVSAQGSVAVKRVDGNRWERVTRRSEVCEGDTIRTGSRSRAALSLVNETVMRINQKSTAKLENFAPQEETRSVLRLLSGIIQFFSRKPKNYQISTVTATIGIRGTEFVVSADDNKTDLTVFEGVVQAENDTSPLALGGGETVSIVAGQTMRARTLVSPRDQVQWGLYYPPVLSVGEITDPGLQGALQCINQADYDCAFESLDGVAADDRDGDYLRLRSALLVTLGQTEDAGDLIDDLLLIDSNDAVAYALKSVIAVSQNRIDDALIDGTQAYDQQPKLASAGIALSYAQQASLDLAAAADTLQEVVDNHPQNALAWARLAELQLALGNVATARESAQQAVSLGTDVSRAHMILGYTALAQIDTDAAVVSFNKSLEKDSADPLAHLGLGLALIREGALVEGRREIEAAVALDSNNAILRPYLGRAYFEENRSPLDADQYAIAKELDPNDPTAYLFDALRKHAENNPVGAAQDLQGSIERNDNRAVYRGRNLLDQDRAAKGASLSRIYDTLGFTTLGINESSNSLAIDPANDSAHRFLSDSYRNIRRREISRVSELLQSQMLQDVNLNPVQPSASATNLNIGSGAGNIGLNEFSGLFESNNFQPAVTLTSGSNGTSSTEVVLSGVHDSLSYSVGGFQYKTDGWRENNEQEEDLANVFLQWAATPVLNLQLEISTRDSTQGDLAFNFDPEAFDPSLTEKRDFDSERFGLRYSPSPNSDLLVSHTSSERVQRVTRDILDLLPNPDFPPVIPPCEVLPPFLQDPGVNCFIVPPAPFIPVPGVLDTVQTDEGTQNEIQYIHNFSNANLVVGLAKSEFDIERDTSTLNPGSILAGVEEFEVEHSKAYIYSSFSFGQGIDLTVGVSKDEYEEEPTDESETNGKLGLIWKPDSRHVFRLASFEAMKPALVNNRTLEPTQIAGFNQIFDDTNGAKTSSDAIGYDYIVNSNVSLGIELTQRDIEEPVIDAVAGSTIFEDREESVNRLYLHWTPNGSVAMSLQAISDEYEADSGITTFSTGSPEEVETTSIPVAIKYFSTNGWFAGLKITAVDQEVKRVVDPFAEPGTPVASGDDKFEIVDLSIGYRVPKRRGTLSLNILNATDEEFSYQDDSYREFRDEPSTGPYFPETTVQFQANLVF